MNIDILHRPTALGNLLAGRIWPAGRRLPMHALRLSFYVMFMLLFYVTFTLCFTYTFTFVYDDLRFCLRFTFCLRYLSVLCVNLFLGFSF